MELGKEDTLVVQIPAPLLPTLGSWTVVFLPSARFTTVGQAPRHPFKCKPLKWPGPVLRSRRAQPSSCTSQIHTLHLHTGSRWGKSIWARMERGDRCSAWRRGDRIIKTNKQMGTHSPGFQRQPCYCQAGLTSLCLSFLLCEMGGVLSAIPPPRCMTIVRVQDMNNRPQHMPGTQ